MLRSWFTGLERHWSDYGDLPRRKLVKAIFDGMADCDYLYSCLWRGVLPRLPPWNQGRQSQLRLWLQMSRKTLSAVRQPRRITVAYRCEANHFAPAGIQVKHWPTNCGAKERCHGDSFFVFCLTSFSTALISIPLVYGLFSVPAPLFNLLAGSSAGFFACLTFGFLSIIRRAVFATGSAPCSEGRKPR